MASSAQWTWVWAYSRRWWRTGKPDMLPSMGLERVRYDWVTEKQLNKEQVSRGASASLLGGMPARTRPVRVKAELWMQVLTSQPKLRIWTSKHSIPNPCGLFPTPLHHLCLPSTTRLAVSLLEHDQGPQTHCLSPAWCVMKSQGPSSGWAGKQTQDGHSDVASYKGWRHRCGFTILEQPK